MKTFISFQAYKYPLTITSYHLVIKLMMSFIVRWIYKLVTGKSRILLDARTSLKTMAPTGFASGIDIGFSQWGLELVQVSLYTMTKSSTIIFILFFAILLGLERKSWSLVIIVVLISSGLFLFTYKSTEFNLVGFSILLFASFTSGMRWSFAQLVMQKAKIGLHNPIDMIFHMQPWMILALLPFTVGFEGNQVLQKLLQLQESSYDKTFNALFKISFGAVLAFFMEISEFLVLAWTSSLTLSMAGIFKVSLLYFLRNIYKKLTLFQEIIQLVLAVEINNDQMTGMNILGLVMCLGGICCHLIHKYSLIIKNDVQIEEDEVAESFPRNVVTSGNGTVKSLGQRVPLLDSQLLETDTDEENSNEQNSSEVIFDVLKRRDANR